MPRASHIVSTEAARAALDVYLEAGGVIEDLGAQLQTRFPRPARYGKSWTKLLRRIASGVQEVTRDTIVETIVSEMEAGHAVTR